MRNINQYFDIIYSVLDSSVATDYQIDCRGIWSTEGIVQGTVHFFDGSRLEFTERVVIRSRRPVKLAYRYQYIREHERIFGYDSSPHHPHLLTFPHHKHEGRRVIAANEPTLQQVLDEILTQFKV